MFSTTLPRSYLDKAGTLCWLSWSMNAREHTWWWGKQYQRRLHHRTRGARLKARATWLSLTSLQPPNFHLLDNRMDELRTSTITQYEMRECCALIFTETSVLETMANSRLTLTPSTIENYLKCVFSQHSYTVDSAVEVSQRQADGFDCILLAPTTCSTCSLTSFVHRTGTSLL